VPRRRKQDIVASLRGMAILVVTLLAFIVFLILFVMFERLVLG
jgi:hypothetical protein